MGYKLALPEPPVPLLSCTAEELALDVLLTEAKARLRSNGIEPEFSEVEELAFQDDLDIEIFCDIALDGSEGASVGDQMGAHGLPPGRPAVLLPNPGPFGPWPFKPESFQTSDLLDR